jgi:hypothetical protein
MSLLTWLKNAISNLFKDNYVYSSKKALCVGINNYPEPRNRLEGCIGDARTWSKLLQEVKGFPTPDILIDSEATIFTVTSRLKKMVTNAKPGDVLVFTFSGHGTSIPTKHEDEPDGRDEAICLYNGLVSDDTIHDILSLAPEGSSITMILDSCHSGTMLKNFTAGEGHVARKLRYMPPKDDMFSKMVSELDVKNRMLAPHQDIRMWEILLAGCKSNEYSYDANIEGKACGAFSHYSSKLITENPNITYGQFSTMIDSYLPSSYHPQHPQVECNPANLNRVIFT